MPRRSVIRDEKAVSPVIATIIIVAVAIVMSIAVAYWVLGLAGTFTRYEKLEIVSAYAEGSSLKYRNATLSNQGVVYNNVTGWNVTAKLRNTGSATATVNLILINGKPADIFNGTTTDINSRKTVYAWVLINGKLPNEVLPVTIEPGKEYTFKITIPRADFDGTAFTPGMTVEITFHTAAGSDYPKVVVLP